MNEFLRAALAEAQKGQAAGGIPIGSVLVILALMERIPLTVGVLGHEGSTLVVVLNSLRLLVAKRTG